MRSSFYALILSVIVAGVAGFSIHKIENESSQELNTKPLAAGVRKATMEKWEATAEGLAFKLWQASPAGQKIQASEMKIRNHILDSTNMEAVITSLSLPPGSRLGFGMMVRINDDEYILNFGPEKLNEFQQLHDLNVNDTIVIRSHFMSHAPKYSFPIVLGNYVERDRQVLYKSSLRKNGC